MITIRLQRTLFIYCGTSAGEVAWRAKRKIYETFGNIPIIRHLWFDIDTNVTPEAKPWFTPMERVELSGFDPAQVIKHLDSYPTIKNWWPKSNVPAGFLSGAGSPQQMRLVGRMALFRMYNDRTYGMAVADKLKAAIESLSKIENVRATEAMSNENIEYVVEENGYRIVMVFTPCGGTGSSMGIDLAYLCRNLLNGKQPTIISIGMMPSVIDQAIKNETTQQREKIRANAYAFFKEVNYLSENPSWQVEYPEGPPLSIESSPFNYRFVVGIENQAGYRLNSAEDVYNMIAQSIFMDTCSSLSGTMRGFSTNVMALGTRFEGMQRSLSSLASSTLIFPKNRLKSYCGNRFSAAMISEGFLGEPDKNAVEASLSSLLSQQGLRDADLNNSLINQSTINMQYEASIRKSDAVDLAISQIDTQEKLNQQTREDEAEKIKTNAQTVLATAKEDLNRELTHLMITKGVGYVKSMIKTLLRNAPSGMIDANTTSLEGLKARIVQQGSCDSDLEIAKNELNNLRGALSRLDDGVEDKLERVFDKKGWSRKFAVYKNKCLTAMHELNDVSLQLKAQQSAIQIYDQLKAWLGDYEIGLNSIEASMQRLVEKQEQNTKRLRDKKDNDVHDFEFLQEVEVDFETYYQEHVKNLDARQTFSSIIPVGKADNIHDLVNWVEDRLGTVSLEYAAAFFEDSLEKTSILDVLEDLALKKNVDVEKYIEETIQEINRYCHPFWQYDHNRGLHDMEGKSLIGLERDDHPLLPKTFRSNPQFLVQSTGFRDRIDVMRVQHGLPAFMLSEMEECKLLYEKIRGERDPLHVLPNIEFAQEIIPEKGKKNREMFALGLAFEYIIQSGSWYYYDPDRKFKTHKISPSNEHRLGQGRENAEDTFSRQEAWSQDVDEKIESEIRQIGNETAIDKLESTIQEYYQLISKLGNNDSRRKQFEKEVSALKSKQRSLGKII